MVICEDSCFDFDKLRNKYIDEDIKRIKNLMNYLLYNLFIFFINIHTILNNIGVSIKNLIIRNRYDDLIYEVEYINHINYYKETIYNLSIIQKFLLLFNTNRIEYDINNDTKNNIKKIIKSNWTGYIIIKYYDKEKDNKVLINLSLFKNTNFLFKHIDLIISNVIQNFIKNIVVYDDKNILYTEIKYKNKTEDVTENFRKIKNSLKNNNIRLEDLLLLLNTDICNSNNYLDTDLNDINLIVTDGDLEETKFKMKDYINYKTLYEDIAQNKTN